MKSRIVRTMALVAAMVMCVGMTAFAGPSKEVTGVVTSVKGGNTALGMPGENDADKIENLKKQENLKAALGDDYNENMKVADVKEVKETGDNKFPLTLTFDVTGVTDKCTGYFLVWNGNQWVKVPAVMGNGTMTGTFDFVGLTAFVTHCPGSSSTSPQTSASVASTVACVGLASAAVALGLKKKER